MQVIWDFIQKELLGMSWLNRVIGSLLELFGLDITSRVGGSVQFFLYDTIKIMVLLGFLILIISYIQSYFPPERTKKILGRFHGIGANCVAALLGTVTPFCSCSSIPLFIGFTSAGLPLGVTFSFLISSITSRVGGSVQFFLYDTIKIMVLLGFLILIISYIQSYFPPERTKKILGRFHGIGANCVAALLGTVTPFCSCSSIPLFIGFTSAGLPLGVTFSFLISSPMVDLGSLVLLMSIFGWKVAVLYVVLGLVIAVIGGTVIEKLHLETQVQEFIRKANSIDIPQEKLTFKDRIKYAWEQVVETAKKVFPYVLVGVGIGAVIHNWIPEDLVVKILGNGNPFGVIIATLVGVPMYADIFGTIPIAEALLAKGANLGVVLSFMMGVTTLSLPSMIMLKKAIKPKLLGIFIVICAVGIIIVGYFFNAIQGLIL